MVFVTGEVGVGKTSLVGAFLEELTETELDEAPFVLKGAGVEHYGRDEAYHPLLNALDRVARSTQGATSTLVRWAPTWLAQMPWLIDSKDRESYPDGPIAATTTNMNLEFCHALEALAEQRPIVLWLGDLHWADPSTVDVLAALANESAPLRLLVIATYRPVDAAVRSHPIAPLKRTLLRAHAAQEIALELLDEAAVHRYLTVRFGTEPDPELLALVVEQTDGNPLFMVRLIDYLIAEGWLIPQAGDSGLGWPTHPIEDWRQQVPESFRSLIDAQLEHVTLDERNVLQAAAVAGTEFAARSVAASLDLDVETVEQTCTRLARWGLFLEDAGVERWPDGSASERYRFRHDVCRRYMYDDIPAATRQHLHGRLAERLEVAFTGASNAIATALAFHFERAGDVDHAVQYLMAGATSMRERAGDREAVACFKRAFELLADLPESDEHARQELELRMQLARELEVSRVFGATEQMVSLTRAQALCTRLGDERALGAVINFQVRSLTTQGDLDAAWALGQTSLEIATASGDSVLRPAAHYALGTTALLRGALDGAEEHHRLALDAAKGVSPGDSEALFGVDFPCFSLGQSSWTAWLRGYPDEARRRAQACLARAKPVEEQRLRAFAMTLALRVELFRRDEDAASRLAQARSELLEAYEFQFAYPLIHAANGWWIARTEDIDSAVAYLKQNMTSSREVHALRGASLLFATLAELELERGNESAALAALDEANEFIENTGERFFEAEIHRLRGEALRLDADDRAAEAHFRSALDVAHEQGALSLELRAVSSLARLLMDAGHGSDARPLLESVYDRFTEGFDTADLQDAKTLLAAL
jgi:predicted ATPase